ncbi:protein-L-isoaspartate(D-aspartate) O-methyltransferase [Halalkalibaculum sp. DA384]|uniref:protein-L-isoaspartate(D-aspartate) O-methyltransferase n=1 Tax=Halalkalibaculum sp. DA384 TaxID=3373606 RepID=UPI0037550379
METGSKLFFLLLLPFLGTVAISLTGVVASTAYSDQAGRPDLHSGYELVPDGAAIDTVTWNRPRFRERQEERNNLVRQVKQQGIDNERVIDAMRHVPRHLFVPESRREQAYQNRPLPIGNNQTISQPYIVAFMTQLLDIQPGDQVLEIGTGSGYQAAVLSELTPNVFTIEIIEELGKRARERFDNLGYSTIQTKIGDGYKGWPEHAPFDGIMITAAAPEIPRPLINQLRPGGILVMPYGEPGGFQVLIRVTKSEEGEIMREEILPVRFVPMTGDVQGN